MTLLNTNAMALMLHMPVNKGKMFKTLDTNFECIPIESEKY